MKQITLFFAVEVLRRKFGVYILKVPQGDNEWISKRRKDTKRENPKNIFFCKIYYSKYQLTKSMYKIIIYVSAEITWSLLQFRDTAKVLKKSALQWPLLYKQEPETWQNNKSMLITIHSWHFLKINNIQAAYFYCYEKMQKLAWIYWRKILLQALATLFEFMGKTIFCWFSFK